MSLFVRVRDHLRWRRNRGSRALRIVRRVGVYAHNLRPQGRPAIFGLAVCAIFRDEASYLAEWVTFHRLQGVEHFWLYDNLSTDDWRSALEPEIEGGLVTVTPWMREPGQIPAYRDCLRRHREDARWIAFIDIDEFLFSPAGCQLPAVLQRFDSYPGVVVNCRVYGTNGHGEPPHGLMIENYVMRSRDVHPYNGFVKCIVYPRKTAGPRHRGPHVFDYLGVAVGEDGKPVCEGRREPPTVEILRINHYYSRSMAEFARKRVRPRVSDGRELAGMQVPPDEVRDETLLRFVPAVRTAMAHRAQRV